MAEKGKGPMTRSEAVAGLCVTLLASYFTAASVCVISNRQQRRSVTTRALIVVAEDGRPVATISARQGSPKFALFDQRHKKRAALFLESNGTPDLYLYDASGKARLSLDLYDSGIGNLAFANGDGEINQPVAILESSKEGQVQIAFHDFRRVRSSGTSFAGGLELEFEHGQPGMQLVNASGKILWHRP